MIQGNSTDYGLDKCTVKVTSDEGEGTGILVTNDGIVATCYHVIGNRETETIYDNIKIHFHDKNIHSACILSKVTESNLNNRICDPVNDIALLKINDPTYLVGDDADKSGICPLSQTVFTGHDFISFGYRMGDFFDQSLGSVGKIIKKTELILSKEIKIQVIQLNCDTIEEGMSGSPVFDVQSQNVIGIISTIYDDEFNKDKDLVLAIPIESIIKVFPELKEKNPGLSETSISNYIKFVIDEYDFKTDFLGRKLQLHQYYVEQDAIFIANGSKDWTIDDEDIIRRYEIYKPSNYKKDKVKNIIESELLKQKDFFRLVVGASFGGGTSTLAKWLAYEYARAYKDTEFYRDGHISVSHNENELNCIPIVLPLKKGLDLESEIYNQKPVKNLLQDIIAPSLKLNARILLILDLDGIKQLSSEQIKELKKKIQGYSQEYPALKVLLLSKLVTFPKEASELTDRFARLLPFDDSQAEEYFRKAGGLQREDYVKLKTSYQELVVFAKPLFAWMICLIYGHDPAANHPVIKKDWSKIKQNALVYLYFFAHIGESKYPDDTGDSENKSRRNWFRVLRAIAALKHISRNNNITFDGIPEKLKEVEVEIDNSLNITSKDALEPIIVKILDEDEDEDVNFAHESFRDYLVATFYVESLLSYSSNNSGNVNAKANYLNQYNLDIGFGIPDSSRIIDFLEGLLEILLDEPDIDAYVAQDIIDLRDSFGYDKKSRKNIKKKITENTDSILKHHYQLISDIGDALEHNPWLRKWYEKNTESSPSFKIGNLWIHLWISLFILNKLEPGLRVSDIKDLDQIMVLSSNRIPPDLKRMKRIDLSKTELSGIDLYRTDLSYANIQEAKLCGANLCEATLVEAKIVRSDLSNAKLFNAFMYGADLSDATLLRADLSGIKLTPIYEESQKEEYRIAKFSNTNLCDANISDAKMHGVDLTDADLARANLDNADLSNATLRRTKLAFTNLSYCNLRGAIIDEPNLAYANLSEADLVGIDFSSCFSGDKKDNFSNVNLSNAKIYEAKPIDRLLNYQSSPPINELLVKTFPRDKEKEIPISTYIVACFSKSIKELSNDGWSMIVDDSLQQIASVEPPGIKGKRTVSKDGKTISFKPSEPLEYSSRYGVIIKDSTGNDLAKWSFTTAPSNIITTNSGIIAMIAEKEIPNVKVIGGLGHDGNPYYRTLDGDLDTRWSNYGKDSWIKYDLGLERNICAMDIGWFKGDKRIYEFEILYSISDKDEKDYELVDPSSFRSSGKTISQERYTFAKVRAKYVKIIVKGNSQNNWASITEVAIYECADSSN